MIAELAQIGLAAIGVVAILIVVLLVLAVVWEILKGVGAFLALPVYVATAILRLPWMVRIRTLAGAMRREAASDLKAWWRDIQGGER
jgi:hypothetical protein